MIALAVPMLFAGYMLVYAAVANGGVFTLHPWAALFADPYTVDPSQAPSSGTPSSPPSGVDPATGRPLRESGGGPAGQTGVDRQTGRPVRESG